MTKPFPDSLDQLSAFIGEISTVAVFLLSSLFFLSMSKSLYETMESIAIWTVMSAIGANGALAMVKSIRTIVGVIKEYRKHAGKSVSRIQSGFIGNSIALKRMTGRGAVALRENL